MRYPQLHCVMLSPGSVSLAGYSLSIATSPPRDGVMSDSCLWHSWLVVAALGNTSHMSPDLLGYRMYTGGGMGIGMATSGYPHMSMTSTWPRHLDGYAVAVPACRSHMSRRMSGTVPGWRGHMSHCHGSFAAFGRMGHRLAHVCRSAVPCHRGSPATAA